MLQLLCSQYAGLISLKRHKVWPKLLTPTVNWAVLFYNFKWHHFTLCISVTCKGNLCLRLQARSCIGGLTFGPISMNGIRSSIICSASTKPCLSKSLIPARSITEVQGIRRGTALSIRHGEFAMPTKRPANCSVLNKKARAHRQIISKFQSTTNVNA